MRHMGSMIGALLIGGSLPAMAHAQASARDDEDQRAGISNDNVIIVTARKKDESELSVPIVIDAMGAEELANRGIGSFQDIAATTPELKATMAAGATGGQIMLRGIGTPGLGAGASSAVAINLDGMMSGDSGIVRFGQFDLERVEILQGPQSLYFGKNASAGVISLITADPTDELYAMLRFGYDFNAKGYTAEGVLSGPLTDTIGARLAVYSKNTDGYFKNPLAFTSQQPSQFQKDFYGPLPVPASRTAPSFDDWGFRLTLTFDPTDALSMRLKATRFKTKSTSTFASQQVFYCPYGDPQLQGLVGLPGLDDCKLDHNATPEGRTATAAESGFAEFGDGSPYSKGDQTLLIGDIDWSIADGLRLHSTTAYYDWSQSSRHNVVYSAYPAISGVDISNQDDFTQELRLSTDLDSPVNGMFGVYYQTGNWETRPLGYLAFPGAVFTIPSPVYQVDSETISAFGEVNWRTLNDQLVLSVGARYVKETKDFTLLDRTITPDWTDLTDVTADMAVDGISSNHFLPEVSLSWQPNGGTNVFVAYKQGAKSGGLNPPTVLLNRFADLSYDDETAEGIEGGIKTVLLDGSLRFDLTAYDYKYKNLQVGSFDPEATASLTRNVAAAKTRGVQIKADYSPAAIPDFSISGSLNYTHARYVDYFGNCYAGQSAADGCNVQGPGGLQQDYAGKALLNAPDWTGHLSASYDTPITESGTSIGMLLTATYTDAYDIVATYPQGARQASSVNVDATLRLHNDERGWEVALIGKNLTDQLRVQWALELPGTGNATTLSDLAGETNAARTIALRVTLRPFEMFR